jgi:predicted tellurium resistance membrane protein TerC
MSGLRYLKPGLAIVLIFIGVKMILSEALKDQLIPDALKPFATISTGLSLGIVGTILGLAVLASLVLPKKPEKDQAEDAQSPPEELRSKETPGQTPG